MDKTERGFTLIEVVVSIVILSIVLISIAQLMLQSNQIATINNEKLVTIDLADAVLERLKVESSLVKNAIEGPHSNPERIDIILDSFNFSGLTITDGLVDLDGHYYEVSAYVTKGPTTDISGTKTNLNLVNVHVEVKHVEVLNDPEVTKSTIKALPGKSKIEGFVQL